GGGAGGGGGASFTLTNDGISATAGTGQTTQDGTAFTTPLQVTVYARGGPVKGAKVTFAAPTTGASGIFASTNTSTASATTNAMGVAAAPRFTANDTQGSYNVNATTSVVSGTAGFSLTNSAAGVSASITASAGTKQSALIGATYTAPLEAKVTNASGDPIQGAQVTFSAETSASGASATFVGGGGSATASTDSTGVAVSPELEANGVAGTFTVTATTEGLSAAADFTLTNLGGASIAPSTGTKQSAVIGAAYAHPLQVKVADADGDPVQGAKVSFSTGTSASGASATFVGGGASATAVTDADGVAVSPELRANGVAGTFTVTATTTGLNVAAAFTLTNLAATPSVLTPGDGSSQRTRAGTAFPVPLSVTVTDTEKNPVPGVGVTFRAPSHGPSGAFPNHKTTVTVKTDAAGIAVAPAFRANGVSGGYVVTASVVGVSQKAAFAMVNEQPTSSGTAPVTHIVGAAATHDGKGYWIVGANGGVFAFGDARFRGSLPGRHVHVTDVVGIAATADAGGYWLVGRNGGVFVFGDAPSR
ncbi:MAG: hypothetical protein ACRDV8_13315, partial [Acidimicrobiales bacterium]